MEGVGVRRLLGDDYQTWVSLDFEYNSERSCLCILIPYMNWRLAVFETGLHMKSGFKRLLPERLVWLGLHTRPHVLDTPRHYPAMH